MDLDFDSTVSDFTPLTDSSLNLYKQLFKKKKKRIGQATRKHVPIT